MSGDGDLARQGVPEINTELPHMARIYDYLLGGDVNFEVDRELAERSCAGLPGGIEGARRNVRADRQWLVKVVSELASKRAVRQFLDLGTGIPNADNVHAVAQQTAPDARIVYVDHDPVVLAHAHKLIHSTPQGAAAFLLRDVCDTDVLLRDAAATLDLSQPVAVILAGVLHYLLDDDAYLVVDRLSRQMAPGSWLCISHLTKDIHPEQMAELERIANASNLAEGVSRFRSRDEVAGFFEGWDWNLIEPGVASLDQWVDTGGEVIPIYGAVGQKPAARLEVEGSPAS